MADISGHSSQGREPTLADTPAAYLVYVLEVAARLGVPEKKLLSGTGIDHEALLLPDARVPAALMRELVERALTLTGEPGLGFYHGLSLKLLAHGRPGLLAMTSPTLGDALLVAERFMALRSTHFAWTTQREQDLCALDLACDAPPGPVRRFLIESAVVGILLMGRALVGHPIPSVTVALSFEEPAYFKRFAHFIAGRVSFGHERDVIRFPHAVLSESVVTADPWVARRVAEECEAELLVLDAQARTVREIRRALQAAGANLPSLGDVARARHTSERTLKRRLSEHGTTFRALVDDVRRERAVLLLAQDRLTVEQVAERLGYTDAASFHRAFQRWFGMPPNAYRTRATSE